MNKRKQKASTAHEGRATKLVVLILTILLIVGCVEAETGDTETPSDRNASQTSAPPSSTPVLSLPLTAHADGWEFVVREVELFAELQDGQRTVRPEKGVFVVFVGSLANMTGEEECVKSHHWDLVNTESGEEYEWGFSAESILKERLNLDYPGAFNGICVGSGQQADIFVPFDVDPSAPLSLTLLPTWDGEPVALGSAETLIASASITPEPTVADESPTPPPTSLPTATSLPTPTSISVIGVVQQTSNLRAGPGTNFDIIGSAQAGDEVVVYGKNFDGSWLQVDEAGAAWIWIELVDIPVEVASLPELPNATPTAHPTTTVIPTATAILTEAASPTATTLPDTAGMSEWLVFHGQKAGVRDIRWDYSLNYFTPDEGKVYLSLYIVAVNDTDVEVTFRSSDFAVVDGGGGITPQVIFGSVSPEFGSCTVKPAGVCEGWWTTMIWDRLEVRNDLFLRWDPTWDDDPQETPINQP